MMLDSYQYIHSAERLDDLDDWIHQDDLPSEREFENQIEMALIFLGEYEWNFRRGIFTGTRGKVPLRIVEPEVAFTNVEYKERQRRGVYVVSDETLERIRKARVKNYAKKSKTISKC